MFPWTKHDLKKEGLNLHLESTALESGKTNRSENTNVQSNGKAKH